MGGTVFAGLVIQSLHGLTPQFSSPLKLPSEFLFHSNLPFEFNQCSLGDTLTEFIFERLAVGKLVWKNFPVHCVFGASMEFFQRHNLNIFVQLAPTDFRCVFGCPPGIGVFRFGLGYGLFSRPICRKRPSIETELPGASGPQLPRPR